MQKIDLEAPFLQKKEQEGETRRKKDLTIHNVPKSKSTDTSERHSDKMRALESFFETFFHNFLKIKLCIRLGRNDTTSEELSITESRMNMVLHDNKK